MSTAKPTINEAFAARRAELLLARRYDFGKYRPWGEADYAPLDGFCKHCGFDLVADSGDDYPTANIVKCPKCLKWFGN